MNTSSILGFFKEIVIDRSIGGKPLNDNIVIVTACNPSGRKAISDGGSFREQDLGKDWASGHYRVNELPASMAKLKWIYGSLDSVQEKEFILRRLRMLDEEIPYSCVMELTEMIAMSQEAIRSFAFTNINDGLKRVSPETICKFDVEQRAKSTVSLRDIQRAFNFFLFFCNEFFGIQNSKVDKYRQSMLLAVAVVYYLRLDSICRKKYLEKMSKLDGYERGTMGLKDILDDAMNMIVEESEIPNGIALTRGLKENIFMTVICALSSTPLMIIGPPGSSKVRVDIFLHVVKFY